MKNVIVLLPKKVGIEGLEGQTRGICLQRLMAKRCCGRLTMLLGIEMENVQRDRKFWIGVGTFS